MKKVLEGLTCRPLWVSHLGCLKGCLNYLEMDLSEAWLFGITGHAFVNNIAFDVCPSGPTAWQCCMLFELGKNAGFEVETVYAQKSDPDFAEKQVEAWTFVRKAIDEGYPCYGWELKRSEYYAIIGYDEAGYVFHGHGDDGVVKPWNTLGDTQIGLMIVHRVKPGRAIDDGVAVRASLDFAVQFARSRTWMMHDNYHSGPEGFGVWAKALETGRANGFGVAYNAVIWAECRKQAVGFFKEVIARGIFSSDELAEAQLAYQKSADALQAVSEQFPFFGYREEHIKDSRRIKKAIDLLGQVQQAEEQAIGALERLLNENETIVPSQTASIGQLS